MAVVSALHLLPRQGSGRPVLIPLSRRAVRASLDTLAPRHMDPIDGVPEIILRFAFLGENRVHLPRKPDRAGHSPDPYLPRRPVLPLSVRVGIGGATANEVGRLRHSSRLPGDDRVCSACTPLS